MMEKLSGKEDISCSVCGSPLEYRVTLPLIAVFNVCDKSIKCNEVKALSPEGGIYDVKCIKDAKHFNDMNNYIFCVDKMKFSNMLMSANLEFEIKKKTNTMLDREQKHRIKDDFEKEQAAFLIDLLGFIGYSAGNLLFDYYDSHGTTYDGVLNKCIKMISEDIEKKIESRESLIDDGAEITGSLLKSKLFLSFLFNEEEKQQLVEDIIREYIKKCPQYKRGDFKKMPSDMDLLKLL